MPYDILKIIIAKLYIFLSAQIIIVQFCAFLYL